MLKNDLALILRTIRKQAGYSFINIFGLAVGMACCLFMTLWVMDELSFDRFHENARDLYRVEEDQNYSGRVFHVTVTPFPLAPALKDEIPEIVEATRIVRSGGRLFRAGDKSFYEDRVIAVDPSFLRMFSFPIVAGDAAAALAAPASVILTEDAARRYFGGEDPLGRALTVNGALELKVTAVARNVPPNSTVRFDALIPYELLKREGRTQEDFNGNSVWTYVRLRPDASVPAVDAKIRDFVKRRAPNNDVELELSPLTRIHLHQYAGFETAPTAVRYVYAFSLIAAFVLLIACINFMNLATARSAGRAKEVGLRKTVGALRRHLVVRFYCESLTYAFLSMALALILVKALLPWFNALSGKEISLGLWSNLRVLAGIAGITLLTGLLAGSYPAVVLSAFRPALVLKSGLRSGAGGARFRRLMVVVQFALSVFLIIGTLVVQRQMRYMRTKALGFDKEQVVIVPLRGDTASSYEALRAELRKDSRIIGVTAANHLPSNIRSNSGSVSWPEKDPGRDVLVSMSSVDYDYIDVLRIGLVEGRNFSRELETDRGGAFLVNEEVRKLMGKRSVVGEPFSLGGRDGRIVGVMADFHFETLQSKIEPLAIHLSGPGPEQGFDRFNVLLARISPADIEGAREAIRRSWNAVLPGYPFDIGFLDEQVDGLYQAEDRAARLLRTFSVLAIVIACLGLFGLAAFMAERRTREVGIRKVLGASTARVTALLCREFFVLVLLANILVWPIAYFTLDRWLKTYAFRIALGMSAFVLALAAALAVAMATVGFQAVKAALASPVKSLKYE